MKRIRLLILTILVLMVITGCSYTAHKEYFTDSSAYVEIWELTGIKTNAVSGESIFPKNIADLKVERFFCRYDEQLPLGEGIQVFLHVEYEEAPFLDEQERIKSIAQNCDEYFIDDTYSFFATHFAESGFFEYAAIDPTKKVICYFYLQDLPYEEIELDSTFIPDGYVHYGEIEKAN